MRIGNLTINRGSALALLFGLLALAGCVAYEPYPAAPVYYSAPAYYYQPCCASSFSFNYSHRDGGYYHHRHWR
jgi:hypothetical protein